MKKFLLLVAMLASQSHAITVAVTNNLDAGPGSLRQAVLNVNASVDPANKIQFGIAGGPPVKITLTSAGLPAFTKQVTVDGTTQPGWIANAAAIILSCPSMIVTGFTLAGPPSIIRGIRIQDITNSSFNSTAIGLNSPGHTIADSQIISNYFGIVINSASNTIGGFPATTNRNVVSGNVNRGIFVATGAGQNIISGNLIGTDPSGTAPMGNGNIGITIAASPGNIIGGTNGVETRNVISGNIGNGITLTAFSGISGANNNIIVGNYIGLNAAGSGIISNTGSGILVGDGISNRVGGVNLGEGNVIAGNVSSGISLSGTNTFSTLVQGNLVGTFADGITAPALVNNQQSGVDVQGSIDTLIGGSSAAARNVISGNRFNGARVQLAALRCTLQGNFIGVQSNGVAALSNGIFGVAIAASTNTTVRGNVVSGNVSSGIDVSNSNTVGAVIQGNFVGTDLTGKIPLPNGISAVRIEGSDGVLVGGTNSGDGNVIAFNLGRGISVETNTPGRGVKNSFLGNLIYSNSNVGIDLGLNGSTPNDVAPDADTGANNLQNYPVITNAQQGSTILQGRLISGTSQTYRCEFFATNVPQGMIFLGATNIVTSAGGTATFSVVLSATAPTSAYVVATATDTNGNTSELSVPGITVKPGADIDGDGMWDTWEALNFGSPTNTGGVDRDGDGYNNYEEFIADTSPTNINVFFEFVTISNSLPHYPGWVSSAARWYDVDYNTNLINAVWVNLGTNIVGSAGIQSLPDGADQSLRVYRVRVRLP